MAIQKKTRILARAFFESVNKRPVLSIRLRPVSKVPGLFVTCNEKRHPRGMLSSGQVDETCSGEARNIIITGLIINNSKGAAASFTVMSYTAAMDKRA